MGHTATNWKSPLHEMALTTPTCLWNDSAALDELRSSMEHGAVGATCNPVIAYSILKADVSTLRRRVESLLRETPSATEDAIGWKLVEQLSVDAAALLEPIFIAQHGRNGRVSIQTDPRFACDAPALVEQGLRFSQLAPNVIVKVPATRAGIHAIEELTSRGVSINATVSFSLPQAIAVAEAVERGMVRRERSGGEVATMGPVCTLMVGRLDDWMKVLVERDQIAIDPGYLEWAGVAVFKKAYQLYRQRGYRLRLLSAAFRNHMHWSELIGGDVVISPPYEWQKRFIESDIEVRDRIGDAVDPQIVDDLLRKIPDFGRAYVELGLTVDEFDSFGPTRRTLRQFLAAGADLNALVRDTTIPNPDVAPRELTSTAHSTASSRS